jgi:hypothetical protein
MISDTMHHLCSSRTVWTKQRDQNKAHKVKRFHCLAITFCEFQYLMYIVHWSKQQQLFCNYAWCRHYCFVLGTFKIFFAKYFKIFKQLLSTTFILIFKRRFEDFPSIQVCTCYPSFNYSSFPQYPSRFNNHKSILFLINTFASV